MKIRRARPDEAAGLTELVMAAKSHWGYGAAQLEAWRPSLAVTPELLEEQPAFVMESNRLIGFCSLRLDGERCRLENLWILPREMRKQIPSYYIWGSQSRLQTARSNTA